MKSLTGAVVVGLVASVGVVPAAADETAPAVAAGTTIAAGGPASTGGTAATASTVAQANPFSDVPPNHWAYDAIRQLAADGYIQGYPDGTFKGQRPMTRYEMAALVARAVNGMEQKIAAAQSALTAKEQADIATLRRLINAFGPELANVNSRVDDLTKRTDELQREADATAAQLKAMHVGLNFWYRPGTYAQTENGFNGPTTLAATATHPGLGPGLAFPGGSGSTSTVGNGLGPSSFEPATSQNTFLAGTYSHGTAYEGVRLLVNGQFDPRFAYALRLAQKYRYDNGLEQTSTSPGFCTGGGATINSPTCSAIDVPSNSTVNIDYAWVGYFSPGGLYLKAGRYTNSEGPYNYSPLMLGGASQTGVQIGYNDPNGRYRGWFGYDAEGQSAFDQGALGTISCTAMVGFGVGRLNGFSPCGAATEPSAFATGATTAGAPLADNTSTYQGIQAVSDYWIPENNLDGTDIGFSWDSYEGVPFTLWNPSAGLCSGGTLTINTTFACPAGQTYISSTAGPVTGAYVSGQLNTTTGSVFLTQVFGNHDLPQFKTTFEFARRLGSDPFTGSAWVGANDYYFLASYTSKGHIKDGPLLPATGIKGDNDVEFMFTQFGLNGTPGNGGYYGGAASWNQIYFNTYAAMQTYQLTYQYWIDNNLRVGIMAQHYQNIPGVTIPAGSVACPGCYISQINGNALFFDNWLYL